MSVTCIQWAINALRQQGYAIGNTTPETIQQTPWSTVYRFVTDQGYCFLKIVPPALALECNVINTLRETFNAHVPFIIADNPSEHCFLMKDAGITLRDFFKQDFNPGILISVMENYLHLQRATTNQIQMLLNIGLPDWRLEKIPILYQAVIDQEQLLLDDGLTPEELVALHKLTPRLESLCKQLSRYAIHDAISHCDFHDNNVLINLSTGDTTLIDLGEMAITHPFFSINNMLFRTKESYALTEVQYQELQTTVFKHWLDLESEEHLLEILSIIQKCWSIDALFTEYRLITSVEPQHYLPLLREGRLSRKLRFWMKQAST